MPGAATVSPPFLAPFREIKPSGGDDYANAQAALTACIADGKELLIRGGKLRLSAGLTGDFTGNTMGLTIRGNGPGCGLEPYDSSDDGIELMVLSGGSVSLVCVENLTFQGRGAANNMTGGCGLRIHGMWGTTIKNVLCRKTYDGIVQSGDAPADANGSQVQDIDRFMCLDVQRYGLWLKGSTEITVRNVLMYTGGASPVPGSIALLIESRDSINVHRFDCINFETGCKVKMSGTSLDINGGIWLEQVMCDTGTDGFIFDGTGDDLDEIECHSCWAGYNSGVGVTIKGSALKAVRWYGGIVQANAQGGFDIQSGSATDSQHVIADAQILGNGTYGVRVASGVGGVTISRNRMANATNYGTAFSTQTHGISLGGSHQNLRIFDNDLRDNGTGPLTGDPAGAGNRVYNNLGLNPKGVLGPPTVPATTVAYTNTYGYDCTVYVAGGTVTAIAVGGTATGVTSGMFRVPAGQSITLTYSSAPTWVWIAD